MSQYYNFKKVQVVPSGMDFLDIVLSKINRKTPTVIHPNYQISRIRQFYMRKVKFADDCFKEKLDQILSDFPKLDEVHPFYADLLNVLYDRDHYKLALAQINTARHLIDAVAKDYARLLKFGDSLFRCKQLKKAALGRMATIMKRQKDSLLYLEQVRMHLARLPAIDPNTRTLIVCGAPNVGKSSFVNKVTRADVDVQPYAFTTKSLFVGHMDYKYLRWQCIDTPGILDHPLENRNTIEMQSITALAHLRACIVFFIDLSEQCGYSIKEQVSLYNSIKPLFANKPTMLVVNKVDLKKVDDLDPEQRALIDEIISDVDVTMTEISCYTDEGVMKLRNLACDRLLASRVEMKLKGSKISNVLNKLHLAQPVARDERERLPCIPEGALNRPEYDSTDPMRPRLAKDIEVENGGAGVYNVDLKDNYLIRPEWKHDIIPEIYNGKNVADFIDPEIEEKLQALEDEEERLIEQGYYNEDIELENEDEFNIRIAAGKLKKDRALKILAHKAKTGKNKSALPRAAVARRSRLEEFEAHLEKIGNKGSSDTVRAQSQKRSRTSSVMMDLDDNDRSKSKGPTVTRDRSVQGLRNISQKSVATQMMYKVQKKSNLLAKRGESDREVKTKMPKHLFAGKRGNGKTSHR